MTQFTAISKMSHILFLFLIGLLFLFGGMESFGQVTTADVVGTVIDAAGAAIPQAHVVLVNTETQATVSVDSDASGEYVFNLLAPGKYSLRVEATSFKVLVIPSIILAAGDRSRENATMQNGQVTETVEVAAETPLLQRESSTIGSVVSEQSVQDLPLNGRNFINLVQIQPGVNSGQPNASSSGTRPEDRRAASTVSANGQNDQYNNELIDGSDNNERFTGSIGVRPSIDAIAEVKVDINNFTAETGRAAGAVINVITKSGTNTLHGSVYEFLRNDIFDARAFFAQQGVVRKPEYRQNQFGGSLGGPIVSNRAFFFGDVEDNRVVRGVSTGNLTVPTLFEAQNPGNFSDIGGPTVPTASLNATGLAYFRLFPLPNVAGAGAQNNFTNVVNNTSFALTTDGRIDYHFRDGDTLYGRYSYNKVEVLVPGALPTVSDQGISVQPNGVLFSFAGASKERIHGALLNYVHAFNDHTLLEAKVGFTRVDISTQNLNVGQNVSTAFGLANGNSSTAPGSTGLTPLLFLSGGYASLGDSPYIPIENANNSFQEQVALNYARGKHNFKFGAQVVRRQINYFQSNEPLGLLLYAGVTGNALEDLLTGLDIGFIRNNTLTKQGFRSWEPSGYAQDDWRVTPNLTVNLGVRYDIYTPFTEAHNVYANYDAPSGTLITGATDPHVGIKTNYSNLAPRVGFSLSLGPSTVFRGGYGISNYPNAEGFSIQLANPPYVYQNTSIGVSSLGAQLPAPVATSTTNLSGALSSAASNFDTARLQMTNLAVQQAFGTKGVLTVAYVGEFGRNQLFEPYINIPHPNGPYPNAANVGPGPAPAFTTSAKLPNVQQILGFEPVGISNYNALQFVFARQFDHGLSFNANYTWGHSLTDDVSSNGGNSSGQGLLAANPGYDYGNAINDVRNRVAISVAYQLPFGTHDHGVKALLTKGYSLNLIDFWQTGLPFTIIDGVTNPNGLAQINLPTITSDRPDITGASFKSVNRSNAQFFNPLSVTPQAPGTAGNEAPNQLYGPNQRSANLSLFKSVTIHGRTSAEFRAECFNISNTPNFIVSQSTYTISSFVPGPAHGPGNPISRVGILPGDTPASTGGFGQISSTNPAANPRQFQFALKLLF